MAVVKTITIKGDTTDAQKSMEDLGDIIQEQIDITIEFEKELRRLEQQLKDTPRGNLQAQTALKNRIGGLKDAIKDQRISIKELNNEQKKARSSTKDFATQLGGQRSVLTNLSAVTGGYANQLFSVFDLFKSGIKNLKAFAVAQRAAFVATGIGAFVVALGLIVTFWDDIVELITGANKALQKQIDLGKEQSDILQTQLDILEIEKTTLENIGKSTDQIKKDIEETLEDQLLLAEATFEQLKSQLEITESKAIELSIWDKLQIAAGGFLGTINVISEKEIERIKELRKGVLEQEKGIANIRRKQSEADKEKINSAKEFRQVIEDNNAFFNSEADKRIAKDQEEADKRLEFEKSTNERLRTLDSETREEKLALEQARAQEDLDNLIGTETQKQDAQLALDILFFEQSEALKATQRQEAKDASDAFFAGEADNAEDAADKQKKLDQSVVDAKISIGKSVLALTIGLAKRNSKIAKGVALGQVTLNTFQGISAALAQSVDPTPGQVIRFANAAAVGVAGLIQVKNILSTNPSGGGGAPSVSGLSPASVPSAPQFNLVDGTGSNQIAESITEQAPLEAFVVSSNVTTSQALNRNIVKEATI